MIPRSHCFIETLPRRGYRFILPPQLFQPLSSAPGLTITPSASPSAASPDQDFADSIAVFPFESAGCDPEMEYLSDGITESLINSLSRLGRLRVVAPDHDVSLSGAGS